MKRTRLSVKRVKPRRTVHPVQPAHRLGDGSVKRAEYRVGVDLRQLAKGRPCMVRLPGCDGGGATTVLAHYRMLPYCGVGIKTNDFVFGSWCCGPCHNACDFREATAMERDEIRHAHARGVFRTQMALIELGLVNL